MLRFIERTAKTWLSISLISIHLMLRFILAIPIYVPEASIFQYISCYGLSWPSWITERWKLISIHLMLRFISAGACVGSGQTIFQYISCYGLSCSIYFLKRQFNISIHLMLRFISLRALCQPEDGNFNTSHVTVYPLLFLLSLLFLQDFNTSHVTVYHHLRNVRMQSRSYFNTSHVTVYQMTVSSCI